MGNGYFEFENYVPAKEMLLKKCISRKFSKKSQSNQGYTEYPSKKLMRKER